MAARVKPRITPLEAVLTRLSTGHGNQRLPPGIRSIEVENIPSSGARKEHRAFLKTILPRIKYHNNHIEIVSSYRIVPDRKKNGVKVSESNQTPSSTESVSTGSKRSPLIRLHFDDLPSQDLKMGNKSVNEITREMLSLIHSTVKAPMEEEANSEEAVENFPVPEVNETETSESATRA